MEQSTKNVLEADSKTMKLAPDNFPGKSVVVKTDNRTFQWIDIGDVNDDKAITIRVEGDYIYQVNEDNLVLSSDYNDFTGAGNHPFFDTKDPENKLQKCTVNSDGTISPDANPKYVLGSWDRSHFVRWILRGSKFAFYFENAQEKLGIT